VATYAVAPANAAPASAPARATSDTKKLILGGAIAATILGGTMGTALLMNNAKVSNNSSNSASSPSAAAVPAAPLSTATPISPSPEASSSGQPAATDNRTPSSITPAAPRPNSSKPASANPSNPAPQAAATKAAASPPATSTPPSARYDTSSTAPNTPSAANNNNQNPTNTIEAYYNDLNNRDYKTAWSKLPQDLQADRQVHPAGYSSFESWWNSVEAIEIRNVQLLNRTAQSSEAIAETNYRMKNGQVRPYRLHYWLGWNEAAQKWEITKIRSK
jgi:serine/threonine protein kinase, bacterial